MGSNAAAENTELERLTFPPRGLVQVMAMRDEFKVVFEKHGDIARTIAGDRETTASLRPIKCKRSNDHMAANFYPSLHAFQIGRALRRIHEK